VKKQPRARDNLEPSAENPHPVVDEPATVLFANGLGDHLLALPALRALGRTFPGQLTLLTAEYPTELLLAGVGFTRTIKVPMRVTGNGGRRFDGRATAELLGPMDWFISLSTWYSSSVSEVVDALQPIRSVGMHRQFDWTVPVDLTKHVADRIFSVARHFDPRARLEDFTGPIPLQPDNVALAAEVRREVGVDRRLLVVHAETSTPAKRWAPERMEEALRRLAADLPDIFVVAVSHGSPPFRADAIGESVLAVSGVPIGSFLALIATADLFLGVDSFGLHAADLWGVPAVGLFGLTSPAEYGFRFSANNRHVDGKGDTSRIAVEQVVDALKAVLAGSGPGR
jgi:ADP-heptose:LPS heptosyltransferase